MILELPGLVDLHRYGLRGVALDDPRTAPQALEALSEGLPAEGVTAFLISPSPSDPDLLPQVLAAAARRLERPLPAARCLGIHLEGPFLAPERRGAFPASWLRPPSIDAVEALWQAAGGWLRLVTLAPELPGAWEAARWLRRRGVRVALGHTAAPADLCRPFLDGPAPLAVHLFNASGGLHPRRPDLAAAVLAHPRARALLIADGIHVDPLWVRIAARALGPRLLLATDALPVAGLPEGAETTFLGAPVRVEGGAARRPDGTLAGSVLRLCDAVAHLARWTGWPWTRAWRAASTGPARVLGRKVRARIEADRVLWDPQAGVAEVWIEGRRVYEG